MPVGKIWVCLGFTSATRVDGGAVETGVEKGNTVVVLETVDQEGARQCKTVGEEKQGPKKTNFNQKVRCISINHSC